MIAGLAVWSLPWYTLAFALLAFLPRWHWLLLGGLLALAFSIYQFRALARNDDDGSEMGIVIAVFSAIGFAIGFLGRTLVLAGVALNFRFLRAAIVLPLIFAVGMASFLCYLAIN